MAHVWHCHTIANGYFFKCPMGYFLPLNVTSQNIDKNGVKIRDCTTFFEELIDYLACDDSLPACRNCLGSVGKLVDHNQLSKRQWSANHEKPLEDYIDWRFLSSLQSSPDADNGCIRFSREKKFALRVYSYLGKIKSIITRILPIIRIPRV